MDRPRSYRLVLASLMLWVAACAPSGDGTIAVTEERRKAPDGPAAGGWRRWGGPLGDFQVQVEGLAHRWPLQGPPAIWSRRLGEGYSAIAAAAGVLVTMYRVGDDEIVTALRADDGETLWEHRYEARTRETNAIEFGKGPNATPLILDEGVVTLGYTGRVHCLTLESGELLWSLDLIDGFGGEVLDFGYSASPIPYDGRVVLLVGGVQGAMAVDPRDGTVVWKSEPTTVSYATPIVANVDGQDQLIYFSADEIIGLEAKSGAFVWSFPVVNEFRNNATGPHWGDDGLLWVATQLDGGTRALHLRRDGERTVVDEVWSSHRLSIHYWNTIRMDDHVYGSIGSNGSILAAIDIGTGEVEWRRRGFEKVNLVHAGDRTILLDAEGQLALASLSPEGVEIHSSVRIADGPTWTVPTLVGTTLYIRDRQAIRALDLGLDHAM